VPLDQNHTLAPLVRKLEQWHPMTDEERAALLGLSHLTRELHAQQYVVWDGDRPSTPVCFFPASHTATSWPVTATARSCRFT
jgi:hypothetical protein